MLVSSAWSQVWLIHENVGPSSTAFAVSGSLATPRDPCRFAAHARRSPAISGFARRAACQSASACMSAPVIR